MTVSKSGADVNDWGRNETEEERADRKWGELIQEVRVAQTGVQILFGFLLTVVFQQKYGTLAQTDKTIYIVTVILGAATTGALIGPVSLHTLILTRPTSAIGRLSNACVISSEPPEPPITIAAWAARPRRR